MNATQALRSALCSSLFLAALAGPSSAGPVRCDLALDREAVPAGSPQTVVIQIALDAVKTRGGGIVKLNSGFYRIIGPVRLSDNTSLIGSGPATILQKGDGFKTAL